MRGVAGGGAPLLAVRVRVLRGCVARRAAVVGGRVCCIGGVLAEDAGEGLVGAGSGVGGVCDCACDGTSVVRVGRGGGEGGEEGFVLCAAFVRAVGFYSVDYRGLISWV